MKSLLGKVRSGYESVGGFVGKTYPVVAGKTSSAVGKFLPMVFAVIAVGLVMLGGTELVFAQGGGASLPSVEFMPIVNFGSIFDTLISTVAPIVAAALGLGLAIWGTKFIFRIIKSMGRG